jgi:hypothetical protein
MMPPFFSANHVAEVAAIGSAAAQERAILAREFDG